MIYKNLGNNLKKARKNKNLTQKELANRLGLSVITIQNYENGRREPGLNVIYDIALQLDVTISELLGDENIENIEDTLSFTACFSVYLDEYIKINNIDKNLVSEDDYLETMDYCNSFLDTYFKKKKI